MRGFMVGAILTSAVVCGPLWGNGLSESIATSKEVKSDTITDNTQNGQNGSNGREFKAGDAARQAGAGKAAAIVAGTGMVAAAIPLLASIDPVEVAAGADLMAKAGLEFGQAAADQGNKDQNQGQKNTLTNGGNGDSGSQDKGNQQPSQGSGSQDAASQLQSNPQLNNFLQSRGVNPDGFIQNLTSGNLTDPQAILSAVGNTTNVTPDDFAKAASSPNVVGDPEGKSTVDIPRITNDDNAKGGRDTGGKDGGSDGAGGGGGGSNVAQKDGSPGGTDAAAGGDIALQQAKAGLAAALAGAGAAPGARKVTGHGGGPGDDEDLLASILAGFGLQKTDVAGSSAKKAALVRAALEGKGVIKLNPKQNIFQLAHRNYRSFQKWRKQQTRVAQK